MPRFRLLTGTYECNNDKDEPVTFRPGDVIETDIDLATRFGAAKFQPLDNDVQVVPNDGQVNAFPGGQVSSGFQQSIRGEPANQNQYTQEALAQKLRQEGAKDSQSKQQRREVLSDPDETEGESLPESSHPRKQQSGPAEAPDTSGKAADEAALGKGAHPQNQGQGQTQTEKAPQGQQPAAKKARPDFDKMSLNDLNRYAEEEEIDLKGAKSRGDVIKALKAH